MKKLLTSYLLCAASLLTFAQSFEGTVKYSISYPVIPEQMKTYTSKLPLDYTLYVKEGIMRIDQDPAVGDLLIQIVDFKSKTGFVIINVANKKLATYIGTDKFEETFQSSVSFTYTKNNAVTDKYGFSAQGIDVTGEAQPMVRRLFVYENLRISNHFIFTNLTALPAFYELNNNGLVSEITAIDVDSSPLSNELFTIPAGYELMSNEEFYETLRVL